MNNQELAQYLNKKKISHSINDDTLVITNHNKDLDLKMLFTISGKVIFENDGYLRLDHLQIVTGKLTFRNKGEVELNNLAIAS